MVFEEEINELENMVIDSDIYIGKGSTPILLSVSYTMIQYLV